MPEYLAPGVYVEEIDTGSKPIEGVSTSTAGMVGVTERGPLAVPVLVTGVGEFVHWFGGFLRELDYDDHRFLPHAVEGFFTNGGKRVYVTRVLDESASKAASPLFDRGDATSVESTLVRPAGEGTGSAATPPVLVILPITGPAAGDWLRIGDGSTAEYRRAAGASIAETVVVPVHLPLSRSHPSTEQAQHRARVAFPAPFTLDQVPARGATSIVVRGLHANIALFVVNDCIEIGPAAQAEYRFVLEATQVTVVTATESTVRLRLDSPLFLDYGNAATPIPLARIDLTAAPVGTANIGTATAGAGLFFVDNRGGNFANRIALVRLGTGGGQEVRRIGEFDSLAIAPDAYAGTDVGTLVESVTFATRSLNNATVANDDHLTLHAGETNGLVVGQRIVLDPSAAPETFTVQAIPSATSVTVSPHVAAVHAVNTPVIPLAKATTAALAAGGRVLALDDRMGITNGTILRVGVGAAAELVSVTAVPALGGVPPDPGNVVVQPGVSQLMLSGTAVAIAGPAAPRAGRQACALALPAQRGADTLYVTDGNAFAAGETLRLTTAGGDVAFYRLAQNAAAVASEMLTLQTPLARAHPQGSTLVGRDPLFDVEALDAGIWGNRLRIVVEDETPGLVSQTTLASFTNPTTMRLASAAGVQPGTILEFFDTTTGALVGDPVKVSNINRAANNAITLAGTGLGALQQNPGLGVRSREFKLTVELLRQPDPSTPSRDTQVIDQEAFRNLSLDPRHSNYIEKAIGSTTGPLRKWDRRTQGPSLYIRVGDRATGAAAEATRLGPEALVDVLPNGRLRPARLRLEQIVGDDAIGSLADDHYVGLDNADPELRTGLESLRNVEEISIVSIPGRVSAQVEQAVIDHCEMLRYRFAVLDSTPEPTDTISDAQSQRQQFDTKYAALYYPWLTIPDPFPENAADIRDYPIPPAGHVLGVYARTDIERGVHKAPANEVVRGIVGLRRKVNKEQQDILNPYPVNINVIRDFRDHNRGIRVYGGRVITSDPDWKYVNVRRLLIFIEASIERGLQWVVFEPNAEPLWARVRRVITNFLNVVWRNGALEGTKAEEAFFVKCDRTTMTQTDIDNGRLIVMVGVAPVKPAEFVIVRIGLWTARSDS